MLYQLAINYLNNEFRDIHNWSINKPITMPINLNLKVTGLKEKMDSWKE